MEGWGDPEGGSGERADTGALGVSGGATEVREARAMDWEEGKAGGRAGTARGAAAVEVKVVKGAMLAEAEG